MYNVGGQLRIDEEGNPMQVGEGQHEANMNNMAGGMQTGTAQFAVIRQENIDLRELVMMQYDVMRDSVHGKVVTHSAPSSHLNSRSSSDSRSISEVYKCYTPTIIVRSSSDSQKARTATPTIIVGVVHGKTVTHGVATNSTYILK